MSRRSRNVDESLFGKARGSRLRRGGKASLGSKVEERIFMTRKELARMKASTVIKTPQDLRDERKAAKKALEHKMRKAKEKRQVMEKLEQIRFANLPPSEADMKKKEEDKKILARATDLVNEAEDDCKAMNAMMQYAQTVTIRDAQKEEKEYWQKRQRLIDMKADLIMEIERLVQLKYYQDREKERKRKMVADRIHITLQIQQNEELAKEKVLEKRREQIRMKARAAELQAEADEAAAAKKVEAKKMLEMVKQDNEDQIAWKKKKKKMEIEEDLLIEQWRIQKAEKERLIEEEKERIAAAKTRKVAAMRAKQKKNMDKNAALDALRAKRAAEANERKARQRELAAAQKRQKSLQEMQQSRRLQAIAKAQALAVEAETEHASFKDNYKVMIKNLDKVGEVQKAKEEFRQNHSIVLRQQIEQREKERKAATIKFYTEGREGLKTMDRKFEHLDRLKQIKIEQLKALGVPDKYVSELAGYDASKALSDDYKRGGKWG